MAERVQPFAFIGRLFGLGTEKLEPVEIESGVPEIKWKMISPINVDVVALHSHKANIDTLTKNGGRPLSFREIQNYLGDTHKNWVLFDTGYKSVLTGNHWRVLDLNNEEGKVTLGFCGNFGNYDMKGIEPFTMSIDTQFFTGLSVQEYSDKSGPLSLEDATLVFKTAKDLLGTDKDILAHKETIYWVDEVVMNPEEARHYKFVPHSQVN